MGQYYIPCVLSEDKQKVIAKTLPIEDWGTGMKLMEHSWFRNGMVRAAVEMLATKFKGCRFVWAGDYAGESVGDKNYYGLSDDCDVDFADLLDTEKVKHPYIDGKVLHTLPDDKYCDYNYLINYDKKCAVLLSPDPESEYSVHPLPLLTAESNGLGGGDYHRGKNMSLVGSWKYDHIGVADEVPEGFVIDDEIPLFSED